MLGTRWTLVPPSLRPLLLRLVPQQPSPSLSDARVISDLTIPQRGTQFRSSPRFSPRRGRELSAINVYFRQDTIPSSTGQAVDREESAKSRIQRPAMQTADRLRFMEN